MQVCPYIPMSVCLSTAWPWVEQTGSQLTRYYGHGRSGSKNTSWYISFTLCVCLSVHPSSCCFALGEIIHHSQKTHTLVKKIITLILNVQYRMYNPCDEAFLLISCHDPDLWHYARSISQIYMYKCTLYMDENHNSLHFVYTDCIHFAFRW